MRMCTRAFGGWATLALALVAAPRASAITQEQGIAALKEVEHLKGIDGSDLACDACLIEVDCIWPCELMCLLDLSNDYVGAVCPICLEYFGCEGCKLLCPSETTHAPTASPSFKPSAGSTMPPSTSPTTAPSAAPVPSPTKGPTVHPTFVPSGSPSKKPTKHPVPAPTEVPSAAPVFNPTASPSPKPTRHPTAAPSGTPSRFPISHPTVPPTTSPTATPTYHPSATPSTVPTSFPTPTPEFYVYYSTDEKYLYEYNYNLGKSSFMFEDCFDGDLKVDQPNQFIFWSCTSTGRLNKFDLASESAETILSDSKGIMGLDVDPSVGMVYYVDQAASTLSQISYSGGNFSVLYTLDDKVPYGLTIVPKSTTDGKTGLFLITASNDEKGYILKGYFDAAEDVETIYTSSYTDIYGILYNADTDMMYWLEERGFANGIYVRKMEYENGCDDDNNCAEQFLQLLDKSYWVAALWDSDLMFASAYAYDKVFAFTMATSGSFETEVAIAETSSAPRCIGYYYGYDTVLPASEFSDHLDSIHAHRNLAALREEGGAAASRSWSGAMPPVVMGAAGFAAGLALVSFAVTRRAARSSNMSV